MSSFAGSRKEGVRLKCWTNLCGIPGLFRYSNLISRLLAIPTNLKGRMLSHRTAPHRAPEARGAVATER